MPGQPWTLPCSRSRKSSHLPSVHLCPGTAMRVHRGLFGFLWLVEPELVVVAVLCSRELLNQEDDGIMEDAQHSEPVHTCKEHTWC